MRSKGKIKSWNDEKGFGFISPFHGNEQVFVHIKAFVNNSRRPVVNDIITYTLSKNAEGKTCAIDANIAGVKKVKKNKRPSSLPSVFSVAYLIIMGGAVHFSTFPLVLFLGYLLLSIITFIAYAVDKSAAQKGAWRTSESTLHLFALIGGWPGALIAQNRLRHKSKKQSFKLVFWITVILNCAALVWLYMPQGAEVLKLINDMSELIENYI